MLTQFLKFAAAGAIGTACQYLTLVLWVEAARGPVVPGSLAGFCVGALVNYFLARRYVFASSRPHAAALPRFGLVAGIGAALNTGIVAALFHTGLHYLLAQVTATAVVLAWNYTANRIWTFSS
jgi:putative flippase GtrA